MKPMLLNTYFKWGHKKNRQLLTGSLICTMVACISYQCWKLYSAINHPEPTHEAPELTAVKTESPKHGDFQFLFGVSDLTEAKTSKADIPKTKLSLVLRGALAGLDNKKYASAIIQGANTEKLYEVGDSLPGGVTLTEVFPDHVVLDRNGQLETLYFPEGGSDSRTLQEYKALDKTKSGGQVQGGYNYPPDDESLEQRMQYLRERLQQANQGN